MERKQIAKPDEFMPIFEDVIGNEAAAEILAKVCFVGQGGNGCKSSILTEINRAAVTRPRRNYRPIPTKLYRTGPSGYRGMLVGVVAASLFLFLDII